MTPAKKEARSAPPRGFTLLELTVAAALTTIVLAAAGTGLILVNKNSVRIRRAGETQETARLAVEGLARDLRGAGFGASSGVITMATGAIPRVVPVIYSGPQTSVVEPSGGTTLSDSVVVISAIPDDVGPGVRVAGIKTDTTSGVQPVICNEAGDSASGGADCQSILFQPLKKPVRPVGSLFLIGDQLNAALVTSSGGGVSGSAPNQTFDFVEKAIAGFGKTGISGFNATDHIFPATVSHWYVRNSGTSAAPQAPSFLVRSHPTIAAAVSTCPSTPDSPWTDETTGGSAIGTDLGAGPVQALRLRYVLDPVGVGNPADFTMVDTMSVCNTLAVTQLREVRVQVVSRALNPETNSNEANQTVYRTPGFETAAGAGWQGAAASSDSYMRRSFVISVAPRNLAGGRL